VAFASANKLANRAEEKAGTEQCIILSHFMDYPAQFLARPWSRYNVCLVIFGPEWWGRHFCRCGTGSLPSSQIAPAAYVNAIRSFRRDPCWLPGSFLVFGRIPPQETCCRSKSDSILSYFRQHDGISQPLLNPIAGFFVSIAQWILNMSST